MQEKTNPQRDFGKGKMWRVIMGQAIPLTIAQLIQLLYNVVDRIYLGHLPGVGSLALTGVGLVFPFTTLVLAFASLYSTGGSPLFSMARGAKDEKQAGEILGQVFTLILITSVLLMAFCFIFREPVLYLVGASDETYYYAEAYLRIYLFGILFSMITTGMNSFISALGYPTTAMWTTVIGAVLNLILDPIFIFALGMGVQGAALATVISQCVSAIWVLHFLFTGRGGIPLKGSCMPLHARTVLRILGLGVSGFMQQATNFVVQIVCNVTLQQWGGDLYVGVMTIINSVREIVSLPVQGISSGAQPVLGYNYGAGENGRVKEGIRFIAVSGVVYTAVLWLIIELFPSPFIRIFSSDAALLEPGIRALRLYFFGFVFMSLQFVGQYTFVALGKSRRAVFFSILRKIVIVVPLTILLPVFLGTDGVFIAEPVSNFLGGLACFITMWLTLYRKL